MNISIRPDTVNFQNDAADNLLEFATSFQSRKGLVEDALAFADGSHTVDDVLGMIMRGEALWWPLPNSFMVTQVITYPQMKHLHVFLAGGDLQEIKDMHDTLVFAARKAGCSAVALTGRRGWVRALNDIGWKEAHATVMFKIEETHVQNSQEHDADH